MCRKMRHPLAGMPARRNEEAHACRPARDISAHTRAVVAQAGGVDGYARALARGGGAGENRAH